MCLKVGLASLAGLPSNWSHAAETCPDGRYPCMTTCNSASVSVVVRHGGQRARGGGAAAAGGDG